MDAQCRAGNESVGDRISSSRKRRLSGFAGSRQPSKSLSAATPRSPARTCSGKTAISRRMPKPASTRAAACSPANAMATGSRWTFPRNSPNPPKRPRSWPRRWEPILIWVGRNQFDYLVEVGDEATCAALKPNHHLLRQLPVRGVIVTARSQRSGLRLRLALLRARIRYR